MKEIIGKENKKNKEKNVRMTYGKGGKWWEVSPTLVNSGMRIKREKEEKEREKRRGRKRIEKERGRKKKEIFPAFQRLNFDGPRVKFNPRNKGYARVSKSGSFVKLQEVGDFPTLIIFSLKVI